MAPRKPSSGPNAGMSPDTIRSLELLKLANNDANVAKAEFNRLASEEVRWALRFLRRQGCSVEVAKELFGNALLNMWGQRSVAEDFNASFKDWLAKTLTMELMIQRRSSSDAISLDMAGTDSSISLPDGPFAPEMDDYDYYRGTDEWTGDVSPIDGHLAERPSQEDLLVAYANPYAQALHEVLSE